MQVKELKEALRKVKPFVYKSATLPALRCVRLFTEGETTWLQATDLETYVTVPIKSLNGPFSEVVVPFQDLVDIVNAVDVQRVALSNSDGGLLIKGDGLGASIEGMLPEEFPEEPINAVATAFWLRGDLLRGIADRVAPCASPELGRPALTAVCLEVSNEKLIAVSADGFKMAWLEEDAGERFTPNCVETISVPAKSLVHIASLSEQNEQVAVEITYADEKPHMARFVFESRARATIMLIEGTFPDWRQIVPKAGCEECDWKGCGECDTGYVVSGPDLKKGLKVLKALTKRMGSYARVKFDSVWDEGLYLSVSHEGKTLVKEIPLITSRGEDSVFYANPEIVRVLVECADADAIVFQYNPSSVSEHGFLVCPVILRPFGDDGWKSVFMLMNPGKEA